MSVYKSELTPERVDALVTYLEGLKSGEHHYPPDFNSNHKRGLRQQAKNFIEKDHLLYYVSVDKLTKLVTHKRVIYNVEEKKSIVKSCHDGIDGGHLGRDKTYNKVSYYIPLS